MKRSTTLRNLTLLSALCVFSLSSLPAEAGVRVRAHVTKKVGPATVHVRLSNGDHGPRIRTHVPVRHRVQRPVLHVHPEDRRIVHRLSVVTGIPEFRLLKKRASGWTWQRIARVHDISKRELRIAKNPERYRHWLARRDHGWKGHGGFDDHADCRYGRDDDRRYGKGKGNGQGRGGGRHGR